MKIPRMRWIIALMLFLATALNYADRQALAIVSPTIRSQFGMTEIDYSRIVAAFFLAYAIMYAGSGYVVDRLGTKRGFSVFITMWSVASVLHAAASSVLGFGACRFLLGLGEPGNWPAATKAVQEWFAPKYRALGVGIFNAGSSLGSAMAPPIVAFLTIRYGWQFAFIAVGVAGFAWLAMWMLLYDPPGTNRWISEGERAQVTSELGLLTEPGPAAPRSVNWGKVIRTRESVALTIARTLTDPVMYFVIFWLPEYLEKERHFDLAMVGKYSWVPFVFGGVAYMFGGWLSASLIGRGWALPKARKFVMAIGAFCLPVAIAAPHVPGAALAIAATCFLTFGHGFWTANLQALPADLFPGHEVGSVSGFSGMGGALAGMFANLGTGYVVTRFSYSPVFLAAGVMHPVAMLIIWRMLPDSRFQRSE
jgi:ACS family hexuronate transporter-like MFS transporter